ncbi:MAG: DnaD domain protein [Malacoplasma sp.]|nr:DnaD domain protein [Malacoplasma sp.]
MSFSIDFEYKYIYKTDFHPNVFLLSKLYATFLSKDAFHMYVYMCEELRNYSNVKFFRNRIKDFLEILNINEIQFEEIRQNLEAFKLLKTYLTEDNKVYFELLEPLSSRNFLENKMFLKNLENKLSKNQIDKLITQYSQIEYFNGKDISINSDIYFSKKNFLEEKTFNFEKLYSNLSATTKIHISISDQVKNEIEYYFKNHNLSFSEIEKCLYASVIKTKNNFEISLNLLQIELEKLVNQSPLNLKEIVKINHNNKLFIEKFSISDLNIIFKNYQNLKPEQFLTSLTLEDLTENEIEVIDKLRKKYLIADSIINIMIDFSIRKTHNELNSKYLYKMAKSFNIENIDSLNKAYDFLFNWDNKVKNNYSKETKKEERKIEKMNISAESEIIENDGDYQVPVYKFEL